MTDENTKKPVSEVWDTAYAVTRANLVAQQANHDAVPEAKAMHSRDCSGGLSGTGNTHTLTDAEREAIELFASLNWTSIRWSAVEKHAATLRKLLERLAPCRDINRA